MYILFCNNNVIVNIIVYVNLLFCIRVKMTNETSLKYFFSVLREKKASFEENYKYFASKLAPKFSLFNFFRSDENTLSYIISNLLDPNGEHEQGTLFLKLFLEMIDDKLGRDKSYLYSMVEKVIDLAKSTTESVTKEIENNQRRIDIVIDFEKFGIGIENKPWACDQENQLFDYSVTLEKRYPSSKGADFLLIYLTGSDWSVDHFTIKPDKLQKLIDENKFLQITYFEIKKWLSNCEKFCVAEKVRFFLRDFIDYCDITFLERVSDMENNDFITNYLLSSETNLELGLEVSAKIEKVKLKLSNDFADKIALRLSEIKPELILEKSEQFGYLPKKNTNLYIYKKEWELCIGVGYDSYDGFYWGITKYEAHNGYLSDADISNIESKLGIKVKRYSNQKWWYSFLVQFEKPYSYWVNDDSNWKAILSNDETLVNIVVDKVIRLYNVICEGKIKM